MAVEAQHDDAGSASDDGVIVTEGLTKVFAGRGGELRAVDDLNLRVHRGEIFGLLGPNGAGKTTTVGMLTTRVIPTSGTASVGGIDVVAPPGRGQAGDRRRPADQHPRSRARRRREPVLPRPLLRDERARSAHAHRRAARTVPARRPRASRTSPSSRAAWRSGSWWRGRSCTTPTCCSSTSRPRASIRRAGSRCGTSSANCTGTARRSCSRRTTWRKPTSSAIASRSSTTASCSRSTHRPRSKRSIGAETEVRMHATGDLDALATVLCALPGVADANVVDDTVFVYVASGGPNLPDIITTAEQNGFAVHRRRREGDDARDRLHQPDREGAARMTAVAVAHARGRHREAHSARCCCATSRCSQGGTRDVHRPHRDAAAAADLRVRVRVPEDRPGDRRRARRVQLLDAARRRRDRERHDLPGVQAVALPLVQDFGYTREIEDRVLAPMPVWAVAAEKVASGAIAGA